MAYIVDMTLTLQHLHHLLETENDGLATPVSKDLLKQAAEEYKGSKIKEEIHDDIEDFVKKLKSEGTLGRDRPLEEITRLLKDPQFCPDFRKRQTP